MLFGAHGYGGQLLLGLWVTVRVAVLSFAASLAFGLLLSGLAGARGALPRAVWRIYASVFTGVPSIVVIFLFYYNGPPAIAALTKPLGLGEIDVTPFAAGIAALGVVYTAYVAEVFRGAFINVAKGQFEAAAALGLSKVTLWRKIILPQVWRLALPGITNVWLVLLKDTALVSLVGLADAIRAADVASGVTKQPFLFYIAVGLAFVALSGVTTEIAGQLEHRASRYLLPQARR